VDEITRRQLAQQRAVLFSQIATTTPVEVAAAQAADKTVTSPVEGTSPGVSASASGDDPFLTITVTADSPEAAQALANSFVRVLPKQLAKLDQLPSAVGALLTVVNPAGLPTSPSSPRPLRNLLIGFALGIVLGAAAALIRETLDTTLRDSDEVRRMTRTTILGTIPREFDDERLPAATRPHSRRSEAYRQVRTNLEFAVDDQPPRSFVVTSPGQGEGKSTTVANLALLTSRAGKRVAIVDADLRKPVLASFFNATSEVGLSDVLTGRAELDHVMQPIAGEDIAVLASGPTVSRPSELLSSPMMEQLLVRLRAGFDLVIVDSPPVLAITDALLVGKHTDGVVVVTRMRRTTRSGLRRALEAVERVHAHTLGIVINATVEPIDKRYGYANDYVSNERDQDESDLHPARANSVPARVEPPVIEQPSVGTPLLPPPPGTAPPPGLPGYPQQAVPPPNAWQQGEQSSLWPAVPSHGAAWPPGHGPTPANGPANGAPATDQSSFGSMGSRSDRRASASGRRRRSRFGQSDSQ
jgi:capsular exopolysaccharide synthesis family protein